MPPEVSIGMPVYNGARFLRATLDNLLAQTFSDFELIISDNASTDETETICRAYAEKDRRIRYIRQPENMGATFNWNYVAQMATGRFLKWSSSNDLCDPTLIEKCVAALQADASAVLAYPRTILMDDNGVQQGKYEKDLEILEPTPSERFGRVATGMALNNAMCGLIRLEVLRKTRGERAYPAGDMVMMAELALHGGFKLVPEYLFFRRVDQASTAKFLSKEKLAHFIKPKGGGMGMPNWRKYGDYYRSLVRTPIGMRERLRAMLAVTRWMIWERRTLLAEFAELFGIGR
ncbi:glycosyl transferase [Sulfuricaulis limicola]|uniref:Glycosyl transferase n=1 Tax=Sulfuricaulis limicola TaxID=1620215 RepID=A0A1B4XGS7_9GAMM|nr:glycosyltransferase family 2 protein [Sulfuricaulis limicola]BAV34021.1 glycosyl transferase [Sulfuricaulis limicola]